MPASRKETLPPLQIRTALYMPGNTAPPMPQFLSHESCVGGMGARPIPVAKRSAKLSGLQQQRSSGVRAIGAPRSVNARGSFPIYDVNELPVKPNKVVLQLSLLIDRELGFRVERARAFGLILVVNVEFPGRQIVRSRS